MFDYQRVTSHQKQPIWTRWGYGMLWYILCTNCRQLLADIVDILDTASLVYLVDLCHIRWFMSPQVIWLRCMLDIELVDWVKNHIVGPLRYSNFNSVDRSKPTIQFARKLTSTYIHLRSFCFDVHWGTRFLTQPYLAIHVRFRWRNICDFLAKEKPWLPW